MYANVATAFLDTARITKALKRRWMEKTFPYGMRYRDESARFDRLYLVPDPWSMKCARETTRFKETNRLISENFGHPATLLEIGCGEGLQSSEFEEICDHLYGIDVSRRAVSRAKRKCPDAAFYVGDMYNLPHSLPIKQFDLVTACEVLYFMADVPRALKRMSGLGRACLVSYYQGPRASMDKYIGEIPGVRLKIVPCEDVSWTFAWWRP